MNLTEQRLSTCTVCRGGHGWQGLAHEVARKRQGLLHLDLALVRGLQAVCWYLHLRAREVEQVRVRVRARARGTARARVRVRVSVRVQVRVSARLRVRVRATSISPSSYCTLKVPSSRSTDCT